MAESPEILDLLGALSKTNKQYITNQNQIQKWQVSIVIINHKLQFNTILFTQHSHPSCQQIQLWEMTSCSHRKKQIFFFIHFENIFP